MSPVKPSFAARLQQQIIAGLQGLPLVTKISVLSCLATLVLWFQDVLLYFFPFLLFILMLAMLGDGKPDLEPFSRGKILGVKADGDRCFWFSTT